MQTFLHFDTANSDWDYTGMKYPPVAVSIRKQMSLFSFTGGSRWRVGWVELDSARKWVVPSSGEIVLPRQAQQGGPCFRTMESRDCLFRIMLLRIVLSAQWKVGWRDWMGLFPLFISLMANASILHQAGRPLEDNPRGSIRKRLRELSQ